MKRVQRTFVSDWSSLFEVKGKEAKVACYDATGYGACYWDHRGVFGLPEEDPRSADAEVYTRSTPSSKSAT